MKLNRTVEGGRLKVEGLIQTFRASDKLADYQSAIQPIANRRYRRSADCKSAVSPVGNRPLFANAYCDSAVRLVPAPAGFPGPSTFNLQPSTPTSYCALFVTFFIALFSACLPALGAIDELPLSTNGPVGQVGTNAFATPINQLLTPAGRQIELPGLRPQAIALSPSGRFLAISGKTSELLLADPASGKIIRHVPLPAARTNEANPDVVSRHILKPDKDAELSYTGLIFSPDGLRIFLSSVNGSIKVFSVDARGNVEGLDSFALPPADAPHRKVEIPAGLALSPDGKRLYVVLNLSNRLAEMDAQTGKVLRTWDVGVAPYDVLLLGTKAYVSNWGGRRPETNSVTGPAGRGTLVRVDPVRYIANEGSVCVVHLSGDGMNTEVMTGLHTSALALSPNRRYLVAANSASDTLSVIDTRTDKIVETIWTRQSPGDVFGASPNALAFDPAGKKLYVCNGTQNAVAVINFDPGKSTLLGLIPVGWFPGAIVLDSRRAELYVTNIKGFAGTRGIKETETNKFNSHEHHGTVSLVPIPGKRELSEHTRVALRNMRYALLTAARLPVRPDQPARPVPERVGEPSLLRHVVYIIKENRTYDQVFGDLKTGNGDSSLCTFGERFTPNQHKLVREFVLLDNTYCSGRISSDGHQWSTTAFATDYMEKSFCDFPRSYPDGMEDSDVDAIAYSPAGFIWDNAVAHKRSLRDYGEFGITDKSWLDASKKQDIKFLDHWRDFTNGTQTIRINSRPAVESLRPYLCNATVGWDLDIPDTFRARQFINELKQFENSGDFPNLVIICLPNDHTSGTRAGSATPAAQVADNDLAFGQIVEAISHSKFWPETCIFAIEDDPQSGWDHVSGYRTTAYVISPYTKRHQVVSTQYNTVSILRTIELILGLPPMNQMDATATPMFDCFTLTSDTTSFTAVANNVALDEVNPEPKKVADPLLRHYARISAKLPLKAPDQCPDDLLNHILWHAMKGSQAPYPTWSVNTSEDRD
jgi:YVTN family beta-propeller protein